MNTHNPPINRNAPRGVLTSSLHLIFASCILWGFTISLSLAQPLSDGIAAIVNSEVITLSELQQELRDETLRLKAKFSGKRLRQKIIQKEYAVLNRLIERKLQIQEAKAKGVTITEEEFQRAMAQLRGNRAPNASLENVSDGVVREELTIRKLLDFEVRRNQMVGPGELLAYYEKSKNQYMEPAEYHLRQILLMPKFDDTEQTLKRKAIDLVGKVQAGQSFAEVAELHSDGPESVRGGDLGYVRRDELLEPLRNTLDQLEPGDMSIPIRTTIGMHILMIEEVKPGEVQSFEQVKAMIHTLLTKRKIQDAQKQWLSSLKDKAYIEIKL